jgi:hypothetical protein
MDPRHLGSLIRVQIRIRISSRIRIRINKDGSGSASKSKGGSESASKKVNIRELEMFKISDFYMDNLRKSKSGETVAVFLNYKSRLI